MRQLTPIEAAATAYREDWLRALADEEGVCSVNPEGLTSKTPSDFEFRYIDIDSVNKGRIDWSTVERINFKDAPSRARRIVRPGDTLISTVRPQLQSHTYAGWPKAEVADVCSTGFAVLRPGSALVAEFLKHLPFSDPVTQQLVAWQCGTSYPAVNERDIRRLVLPCPPPEEQAAIARILDAIDTAIECVQGAIAAAEDLEYSLLHELLGQDQDRPATNVGRAVKVSRRQRVDEVAEVGSGVTLGNDVSGVPYVEFPYLRVANVQDGRIDLATIKTVRVSELDVNRYRLQVDDVLMTEGGDIDKLGRGAIWHGQIENCLHQNHIFRVRADRGKLEPRYFAWIVRSNIAKAYFLRVAKRTTNLASINKTQLRAFRFPVPELEDQRLMADTMEAARATTEGYRMRTDALADLKRSLMHDLLTGKVRTDQLKLDEVAA